MEQGIKRCPRCTETKSTAEFAAKGGGRPGWQSYCRPCRRTINRETVRRRRGWPIDTPKMQGKRPPAPEGSVYQHRGYLLQKATDHHRADRYGWAPQHILVAEDKYGIRITREYTVHHKNGVKDDNRPENLDLRWGNHGKGADVLPALLRLPEMRAIARAVLAHYDD